MKSTRILFCLIALSLFCTLFAGNTNRAKSLKAWADSAENKIGKAGFIPFHKQHLKWAKELNDTAQIERAYGNVVSHYYRLGKVDSLKIVSYEYMHWYERQSKKEVQRYQIWRQYVQRLTEKGMQKEAIAETELLRKDAEKRKSKYGQACSEMCIGYNHRVFSNNVERCIYYYKSALSLFEKTAYYEDAFVVYLNITQIYLPRQEYAKAIETLGHLDRLVKTMQDKKIAINRDQMLRFYQFRVIATLADKGEKAAEKYVRETDRYYFENQECTPKDAWYGYKILCSRTLQNWEKSLVYLDSLFLYNHSIGACYPANHLFKAQCLENLGRLKEACKIYVEYAHLNDSVRTVELDDQLSKYTIQFEVDKLEMEKLELNAKISRDRLTISLAAGIIILVLFLVLVYYYMRSLAMNKKLDIANKEVVKASRVKSSFIQHITHEIRTPLNAIVGFSSLIAEGGLDEEESMEYSQQINSSNAYLLDLVNNMIDIADMDSQLADVPKKEVDANLCCQESIEAIRPLLKESVELQYTPTTAPLLMKTVSPWVKQVLLALLGNANKFMTTGIIRLKCEEDKPLRLVRFIVEDTGPGVSGEYKESIFERFSKVDSFTPGAGLGLSIVRQIMDLVDGKVYLDTNYECGAKFVVEWPIE